MSERCIWRSVLDAPDTYETRRKHQGDARLVKNANGGWYLHTPANPKGYRSQIIGLGSARRAKRRACEQLRKMDERLGHVFGWAIDPEGEDDGE